MKVTSLKDRNPITFFQDVVKEIVEENPNHKCHIGKILLSSMRKNPADAVLQVDAAKDIKDTSGQLLGRSIALAQALRNIGLQVGDVVTVMGKNHIDIVVPMFAALFDGLAFNGVDGSLKKHEMEHVLGLARPKIVFCESSNISMLSEISEDLQFRIVPFTESQDSRYPTLKQFTEQHRGDEKSDDFKAADLDPNTTTAFIFCTSGTTGLPKLADVTHSNYALGLSVVWTSSGPATSALGSGLCIGPVYWLTCVHFHLQAAIYAVTKIQTSADLSWRHIADVVNKYRPALTAMTPALATLLLEHADAMDWTCFHTFIIVGSIVSRDLINALNHHIGMAGTLNAYGLTECCCRVFWKSDNVAGTLGVPVPGIQCRIVDTETGKELDDNQQGELQIKGPNVFRGYYRDELSTKEAFTVDGWFKTGDLMYRNTNQHYCFVDRSKMMLDIHLDGVHYHISPAEIETEIKQLPGVGEAAVTGVMRGEAALPLALVVRNDNKITADDIVEYVKNNLSRPKHLTGGVKFVEEIPLKSIGKFDRMKIKDIATEYYNNEVRKL